MTVSEALQRIRELEDRQIAIVGEWCRTHNAQLERMNDPAWIAATTEIEALLSDPAIEEAYNDRLCAALGADADRYDQRPEQAAVRQSRHMWRGVGTQTKRGGLRKTRLR